MVTARSFMELVTVGYRRLPQVTVDDRVRPGRSGATADNESGKEAQRHRARDPRGRNIFDNDE